MAAADLALDREAERFEVAFDGQIKRGFQRRAPAARAAATQLAASLARIWSNRAEAVILSAGQISGRAIVSMIRSGLYHITVEMLDSVQGGNQGVMVMRDGQLRASRRC